MLPKVATHIFHHTTRAVAAVQNQTSQAIRNALQYQPVTPPSSAGGSTSVTQWGGVSSSSGWGGGSAGPGGAKYNAGSRFYTGYTGPGRSVTQANSSSAQADDNDECPIHPVRIKNVSGTVRTRPRSSSLSLSPQGRVDRGASLGVLEVVQLRARHAFAAHRSITSANDPPLLTDGTDNPILLRHNSTSSHMIASSDIELDITPPPPPLAMKDGTTKDETSSTYDSDLDSASSQAMDDSTIRDDRWFYFRIRQAGHDRDYPRVVEEIEKYRQRPTASVPCYNIAIQALYDNRTSGQPITLVLELYNEMIRRNLTPNLRTYKLMILTLCARDAVIHRVTNSLENRIERRAYAARDYAQDSQIDEQRLVALRSENNFASALMMFKAATTIRDQPLGLPEYNALIRSCAQHNDVKSALNVFQHMERFPEEPPSATTYGFLLTVFCNARDLEGAVQVFSAFKEASKQGLIAWDWAPRPHTARVIEATTERNELSLHSQIQVWNKMIETYIKCGEPDEAVGLFETMLDTPNGINFKATDAPLPNSVTYTTFIDGFCQTGDLQSALAWFNRLLVNDSAAQNPYAPLSQPPRPDHLAWIVMIDNLARSGNVDELNRIFTRLLEVAQADNIAIRAIDRFSVARANFDVIADPNVDPSRSAALIDFVVDHVMSSQSGPGGGSLNNAPSRIMLTEAVTALVARDQIERALTLTEEYVYRQRQLIAQCEADGTSTGAQTLYNLKGLRGVVQTLSAIFFSWRNPDLVSVPILPGKTALRIAALCSHVGLNPQRQISPWYVHSYLESKRLGHSLNFTQREWELLVNAFVALEVPALDQEESELSETILPPPGFVFPGLASLLRDLSNTEFDFEGLGPSLARKVMKALVSKHGFEEATHILRDLGSMFTFMKDLKGVDGVTHGTGIQNGDKTPVLEVSTPGGVHVDLYHSRFVEEWYPANPNVSIHTAYERFESGAQRGIYPSPECIGRLIGGLGRLGDLTKVRSLYQSAQRVLAALEDQKRWQSAGWFVIEDQMIIAFAHAGQPEAAHVHRGRIIDQGGTPSSDAYGALISAVKDTTDDAGNALPLWQEALSRSVRPNIFMYNTIISKLAKARKTDHALQIFEQMRAQGVRPSSVTYGALISACCRVGDAESAERFFMEMTSSENFRARVPPFNTMIQFYAYNKPNRERVLYYYNALLAAQIRPTEHTYKLLLDAYGTIQPVDTTLMEKIFNDLLQDHHIEVQGAHWAAMINAYGCAGKDMNKAIGIFESIEKHPSTSRSKTTLPDAIVYEALFIVLSAHRRPDLIRGYLQRLRSSHIHPTAYVLNAAIKGYAAADDIESARVMFESMKDTPMGVAAPNNRFSHHSISASVPAQAPVYREPSTWEAMVRAELGVGERERAMDLVRRMESRGYPFAVVDRVRMIMYSDALGDSPAPTTPSPISSE
ncbi:hypothetical protein K439DRAFT_1403942 [Ramaria rubella]|nr:hypothetical protein K439DRAFT_1403942 [Ramaria rubella]